MIVILVSLYFVNHKSYEHSLIMYWTSLVFPELTRLSYLDNLPLIPKVDKKRGMYCNYKVIIYVFSEEEKNTW